MQIRIIDANEMRAKNMFDASEAINILKFSAAWSESIFKNNELLDEGIINPDMIFLHLNDQLYQGNPYYEYMINLQKLQPRPMIVLYSGGEIKIEEHSNEHLCIRQGMRTWDFTVSESENFCIIENPVTSAKEIHLIDALEAFKKGKSRTEIFQIFKGIFPEHYLALAILCQGYLAAHAKDNEAIKGILNLPDDKLLGSTYDKKDLTESYEWWKIIETNEVRKELSKNLNKTDLEPLLLAIDRRKNVSNVDCVVNAYKIIALNVR